MEQQKSDFQVKFPLSARKKFWKKLISKINRVIVPFLIIIVFILVFFIFVGSNGTAKGQAEAPNLISGTIFGGFVFLIALFFLVVLRAVFFLVDMLFYFSDEKIKRQ